MTKTTTAQANRYDELPAAQAARVDTLIDAIASGRLALTNDNTTGEIKILRITR